LTAAIEYTPGTRLPISPDAFSVLEKLPPDTTTVGGEGVPEIDIDAIPVITA
jgi:hypothetical protein